jgi:hypothetical protein
MKATTPSGESEPRVGSNVELMGWGVFWVFGVVCAIASYSLYWWNLSIDVIHSRCWIVGLLCAPTYVLACVGFIQGVSRVPCLRLGRAWPTLKCWQRILIVSFTGGAASLLTLYTYFLALLTPTI